MSKVPDLISSVLTALTHARNAKADSQIVVHPVSERPFARIGIQGTDVIVILPAPAVTDVPPVRLSSINVDYGVKCKVLENGKESDEIVILIRLFSPTARTESIFVEVIAMLLRPLARFSQTRLREIVSGLVELFQEVKQVSNATLLGLWGELFVIGNSPDPDAVGSAWHPTPMERFDFSMDAVRVEVKTTTGPRQHHFALEQVKPVPGLDIFVASVVVSESSRGLNVVEMIPWVTEKVKNPEIARHITTTALNTIGSTTDDQSLARIDLDSARMGIRFFDSSSVPQPTPPKFGVSQIRFVVDLQMVKTVDIVQMRTMGRLPRALLGD